MMRVLFAAGLMCSMPLAQAEWDPCGEFLSLSNELGPVVDAVSAQVDRYKSEVQDLKSADSKQGSVDACRVHARMLDRRDEVQREIWSLEKWHKHFSLRQRQCASELVTKGDKDKARKVMRITLNDRGEDVWELRIKVNELSFEANDALRDIASKLENGIHGKCGTACEKPDQVRLSDKVLNMRPIVSKGKSFTNDDIINLYNEYQRIQSIKLTESVKRKLDSGGMRRRTRLFGFRDDDDNVYIAEVNRCTGVFHIAAANPKLLKNLYDANGNFSHLTNYDLKSSNSAYALQFQESGPIDPDIGNEEFVALIADELPFYHLPKLANLAADLPKREARIRKLLDKGRPLVSRGTSVDSQ